MLFIWHRREEEHFCLFRRGTARGVPRSSLVTRNTPAAAIPKTHSRPAFVTEPICHRLPSCLEGGRQNKKIVYKCAVSIKWNEIVSQAAYHSRCRGVPVGRHPAPRPVRWRRHPSVRLYRGKSFPLSASFYIYFECPGTVDSSRKKRRQLEKKVKFYDWGFSLILFCF